jgi:hypothetical protein
MFGLISRSKDPWPLKFTRHNFGARAYNVQRNSVIYDRHEHGAREEPAGPEPSADWRRDWNAGYGVGTGFPPPAQVDWISLDGTEHHARVDIGALFKDRLVRHNVPREDIPEGWLAANAIDPISIDVLMEINDRTITVYTRALVATKEPQIPGNPRSMGRNDLIEVWTHTY